MKPNAILLAFVAAATLLASGCASTMQPRTSAELPYKKYKALGAVVDASRAYPIAFYAEHNQKPVEVIVEYGFPKGRLLAGQWTAHLAARMNQALHEVGLFDRRFSAFAHRVFHNRLSAGNYVYDHKDFNAMKRDIELSRSRLAKLRLVSAKPATTGSMRVARVTVEVTMGGLQRMYQADSGRADWDAHCFDQIARKILGDPGFWKVVQQMM